MSFKDLMADDADNVFLNQNEFAEPENVTYTVASTGETKEIKAIFDDRGYQPTADGRGEKHHRTAMAIILSDAAKGISGPVPGDTIQKSGDDTKWIVFQIENPDDDLITLHLDSTDREDLTREDFRDMGR